MSLIVVETTAEQPLTDELLQDDHERVMPCFEARNVTWRYSLLSTDRHRMICTFDAPDAESVRESYRKAGLQSRPIWSGLIQQEPAQPQRNSTVRHVIEGTYLPLSETDWNEISRKILDYCAEHDIEWLQSYLSLDRTKVIYELNTPDLKSIEEAPHKLGIPVGSFGVALCANRVWSAQVLSP